MKYLAILALTCTLTLPLAAAPKKKAKPAPKKQAPAKKAPAKKPSPPKSLPQQASNVMNEREYIFWVTYTIEAVGDAVSTLSTTYRGEDSLPEQEQYANSIKAARIASELITKKIQEMDSATPPALMARVHESALNMLLEARSLTDEVCQHADNNNPGALVDSVKWRLGRLDDCFAEVQREADVAIQFFHQKNAASPAKSLNSQPPVSPSPAPAQAD